jgi:hypothetical protein
MKQDRRDFIKASTAIGILSVKGASAQAPPVPIGFVVSTRDHADHIACFLQALEDAGYGIETKKQRLFWRSAEGKYGSSHKELYDHAKKHIKKGVTLIVAAGGLVSAGAVAQATSGTTVKFVYLIGRTPLGGDSANPDAGFQALITAFLNSTAKYGGVDQNIVEQNENNWQQLIGVSANNVGLIVNSNNPMTAAEVAAWQNNGHPLVFQASGPENEQQLSTILKLVNAAASDGALQGIVVSADPYLRSFASEFDKRLRDTSGNGGNFPGPVCYPYQEYVDSAVSLQSQRSRSSPYLAIDDNGNITNDAAYYKLGEKVVEFVKGNASGTFSKWDGTNKKWV